MKTLNCDICRGKISSPVSGRNYFHKAHRDICEPCNDKLELQIKPVIRTKEPFAYEWFDRLVKDSIEKAIVKGRI